MAWQVYDAKARFSEFLDASLKEGPQIVTRRGVEAAVLVPIDEWRHLNEKARKVMEEINGSVIVIPYFPGQSSTNIKNEISRILKDKKT